MKRILTPGTKINHLTIIRENFDEQFSHRKGKQWECRCDCGTTRVIENERLLRGVLKGCRKCSQRGRKNTWSRKGFGESTKNRIISSYKSNAKCKNVPFSLRDDEIETLFQGNCYYCGNIPSKVTKLKGHYGEYIYNGIDKKIPHFGYTTDNAVSCCWHCNFMKNNYEEKDFIGIVKKIDETLEAKQTDYHI